MEGKASTCAAKQHDLDAAAYCSMHSTLKNAQLRLASRLFNFTGGCLLRELHYFLLQHIQPLCVCRLLLLLPWCMRQPRLLLLLLLRALAFVGSTCSPAWRSCCCLGCR